MTDRDICITLLKHEEIQKWVIFNRLYIRLYIKFVANNREIRDSAHAAFAPRPNGIPVIVHSNTGTRTDNGSRCNTIEMVGAKRWLPSEQWKCMPSLRYVLPPLTKNPGYVAAIHNPKKKSIRIIFVDKDAYMAKLETCPRTRTFKKSNLRKRILPMRTI